MLFPFLSQVACPKLCPADNKGPEEVFFKFFFLILFYFLTLQYCIGFAIYRNESATGIHVFPILNPFTSF